SFTRNGNTFWLAALSGGDPGQERALILRFARRPFARLRETADRAQLVVKDSVLVDALFRLLQDLLGLGEQHHEEQGDDEQEAEEDHRRHRGQGSAAWNKHGAD